MEVPSEAKKKRKQKTLTLAEKVQIIVDFEGGGGTHETLARKYGVGSSSVSRFLQQKNELRAKLEHFREHGVDSRKTIKEQQLPFMEKSLYLWVLQQREENIIVTPEALRVKGELLLRELQNRGYYEGQNFAFSDGWRRRFMDRFGLQIKKVAGEKASADMEAYLKFKDILKAKIIEMDLNKSQVYNADESAIFVKMLASRSVVLHNDKRPSGRKLNKQRYTFMPCSNIDGTNKLKLMLIGTAVKPRRLPARDLLPVSYANSKNAWQTRCLFATWFFDEFVSSVREFSAEHGLEPKALLLLDNCTAHYDGGDDLVSDDGLIRVMYLPPNVTAECQPMDQGVINAIKTRFKRKLMLKLILEDQNLKFEDRLKKVSLLQSIEWLAEAWDEISSSTIENSWLKLIPQFPGCEWAPAEPEANTADDVKALVTAIDALAGTTTSNEEIESWMVDRVYDDEQNPAWLTSVVFSDGEIVDSVLGVNREDAPLTADSVAEESANNTSMETSFAENQQEPEFVHAIQSVDCLIRFVQDDAAEVIRLRSLRTKLIESEWRKRVQ